MISTTTESDLMNAVKRVTDEPAKVMRVMAELGVTSLKDLHELNEKVWNEGMVLMRHQGDGNDDEVDDDDVDVAVVVVVVVVNVDNVVANDVIIVVV